MKKISVVFLLILFCFPAFAKKQKHKKATKPGNAITSVKIRHTACFGRCPVYEVEVDNKGQAIYRGIRFIKDSGLHMKVIGKRQANQIINRFIKYRIDTCKDRYESRMTDMPGVEVTINYTGKKKEISNANLGPVVLRQCYASIDSLTDDKPDKTWHMVSNMYQNH
jgi:Domain of unknown function (DUF6438)